MLISLHTSAIEGADIWNAYIGTTYIHTYIDVDNKAVKLRKGIADRTNVITLCYRTLKETTKKLFLSFRPKQEYHLNFKSSTMNKAHVQNVTCV